MKTVCIILRSGTEINVKTTECNVVRGLSGKPKRIECGEGAQEFLRYLSMSDVQAVLVYPGDKPDGNASAETAEEAE